MNTTRFLDFRKRKRLYIFACPPTSLPTIPASPSDAHQTLSESPPTPLHRHSVELRFTIHLPLALLSFQRRRRPTSIARRDSTAVVLREIQPETRPSVPPFMTSCARRSPHCICQAVARARARARLTTRRLVSVASTAGPHYENRNRRSSSESWPSAFASPPTVPSNTRRFLSCSRRMRSSTVLRTTNRTARIGLC